MMRSIVCIVTTAHPVFDTRIFHKQAKTLAADGYDVTIIAQHDKDETVDGVRIIALPRPRNRLTRIFGLTWRAFGIARKQRAALYNFHDPELLPIGVLLKLSTRAKVIYDAHEDLPQQILTKHWIPFLLRRPLARMVDAMEKLLARSMDAVVVATEGIAEKFKAHNPLVIHNYPDLQMLPGSNPTSSDRTENVLVYVGGISRIRGALEMIEAVGRLGHIDHLRLDLIGRVEPPELVAKLETLPGFERTCLLGWLRPADIYAHLAEMAIGLVCLHPEPRHVVALPVKLFEYMAAGLPVIASNFPLWKEIVEGNECGLTIDPLSPQEIAEAVEHLLTHPEEAKRMGRQGRRAVEQKYKWETEGKRLLHLYESLLRTT